MCAVLPRGPCATAIGKIQCRRCRHDRRLGRAPVNPTRRLLTSEKSFGRRVVQSPTGGPTHGNTRLEYARRAGVGLAIMRVRSCDCARHDDRAPGWGAGRPDMDPAALPGGLALAPAASYGFTLVSDDAAIPSIPGG